jgi:type I pantothenate kinase
VTLDTTAPIVPGVTDVSQKLRERRPFRVPFVVGVTGAVAAGKSTFAGQLQAAITAWPDGPAVEVVCTDGFLFDNAALEARGLSMRKGFPESYDMAAMSAAVAAVRIGAATFPTYSHVTYDVDPALARRIDRPDVLIVEGLALHDPAAAGLDALVYLDAEEAHLETWFSDRFMRLWQAAEADPGSFYARFRHMDAPRARQFAGEVWRAINLPNLREHIIHARMAADLVIRKGERHQILAVIEAR